MTKTAPIVAIIMGSDSDVPVVKEAAAVFDEFGIAYEMHILSAHRSPRQTHEFAHSAAGKGIKVIIAAAGGAAHLAGVIASMVTVPVIGVPIQTKALSGVDSLYSIVQMPPGVPVATVGINAAKNAAILALQILALSDEKLSGKLKAFKQKLEQDVVKKDHKLVSMGWKNYGS